MADEKAISASLSAFIDLRRLIFPEIVSSPKLLEDEPNPTKNPRSHLPVPLCGTHQEPHARVPRNDDVRARFDQELALRSLLGLAAAEKGFSGSTSQPVPDRAGPTRRSLEIRVVDETALIGGDPIRAKRAAPPSGEARGGRKAVYSREEMEALRFENAAEQRRMWKDVHLGMGPTVRKEYDDDLLASNHPNTVRFDFGHARGRRNKDRSPSGFGAFGAKGRLNTVNVSAN